MGSLGIEYFFDTHQRIFWLYLLVSSMIAAVYILYHREKFKTYLDPKIWWHRSARLDYGYFIVVSLIKSTFIIPLLLSSKEVALLTALTLQELLGYMPAMGWSREAIMLLFSATLFIVSDFTRYWLHRLMHALPFLWRFHRVHHSAEVLNPLTFYRVHPVENVLFGIRYALSAGLVTGLFIYLFGARISLIEVIGVNLFVFAFAMLGSNLRHSHVPLRYGNTIERWVISPFMHQLHHTRMGAEHNYGGALAVWDRLFGTLYITEVSVLQFGLGKGTGHDSILDLLTRPLKLKKEISYEKDRLIT